MMPLDPHAFFFEDVYDAEGSFRPLGHIALDFVDADLDEEIASRERGNVCLTTFFVLSELRGMGLGR